jgi:triphosphoribosyl-dephospho-CoA synthase
MLLVSRSTPDVAPFAMQRSDPARAAHLARALADLVADALVVEVRTTPKPGLVDLRNNGAHADMDVSTFLDSAAALRPLLEKFFTTGAAFAHLPSCEVLEILRPTGLICEHAMLAATNGVNTHKGSIFAFGLLLGAAGRVWARTGRLERNRICAEVAAICDGLVERELMRPGEPRTAGERMFRAHGLTGARGEATSGFATVLRCSLPVLERTLAEGRGLDTALQTAFLHLLATNDDTNTASRGGIEGLAWAKTQARRTIAAGGPDLPDFGARLEALDDAFIERNLSPGGSADLLAITWTFHRLEWA